MKEDRFLDQGFSIEVIALTHPGTRSHTIEQREDKICLFCGHVGKGYPQLAVVVA